MAMPMFVATQIFYYRKDIFEAQGITDLPKTFDELVAVCKAVNNNPVHALATPPTRPNDEHLELDGLSPWFRR